MNARLLMVCMIVSLAISLATVGAYATWATTRSRGVTKIALLDIAEIYRLKENQFSTLIMKPGATEAQRAQALELARNFGVELTQLATTLPAECQCLVLTKAAVVGGTEELTDLTPEIKRRLGLVP